MLKMAEDGGEGQARRAAQGVPEALRANTGAPPDVFISYASQDAAVAATVVEVLERAALTCWIAPRNVVPGALYADEIIRAINEAKVVVLVLSEQAVASAHVGKEIERASSKGRRILALRTDSATLTRAFEYFLSESQWIDVGSEGIEAAGAKLVEAVRRHLTPPSDIKTSVALEQRPLDRKSAIARHPWIAIAPVAVLAIALGYFVVDKFWLSKRVTAERPDATVVIVPASPALVATISEKSVAVLPFLDMSEKKDQEYFSDGLSEELIDLLTKIPDLQVPARTSSFYFKGKQTTISDIAKALRVAHVLEGSVRKSGNVLRITAQLIRVDNGYHLWSETYDRQLDDIFKVQDEIAGAVVRALKASLLPGEAPSATLTTSTEAYDLYLQAEALRRQRSSDDALKAYVYLKRAVSLDPKFALAWSALARILTNDSIDWTRIFNSDSTSQSADADQKWGPSFGSADLNQHWTRSWAQARAAAHAAAEEAIKLGPDLGASHMAMADVLESEPDWSAADRETKKAIELEPANARITLAAAYIAICLGRVAEGLQLAERAAKQDPLGEAISTIAFGQYVSGGLDEAQVSVRKVIELYPTASLNHFVYAMVLLARGDSQAALSELERETLPQFRDVYRPIILNALGRRAEADRGIAMAEEKWANGMAYNIATVYASRNDSDRAFHWLERAYLQHDGGLSWVKVDPLLRSLRQDPRYKAFLLKMRMPE
jgi:TolB-like protein